MAGSLPALLIVLALTAPMMGPAQEGQMGGVGLTVFADSDYKGRNATFRSDTPDLAPYGMDDRISSLRVGPGEMWEVCELPNYGGRCQVFSGAEPQLRQNGWSDIISSVRRVQSDDVYLPIQPPVAGVGLELFANSRFQGDRRVLASEVPDLRRIAFDDRAQSIRLGQSQAWEVCVDTNYRGCRVIDRDMPDLADLDLTRRISSVRPWDQESAARPPQPEGRIVLFDDRNFRGKAIPVDGIRPVLNGFQNKAESVQVTGGLWELCERTGFGGRCAIVSSNVSDLGALGLRNRVNSVRPRDLPY
jgi:hypothetical protein